MSWTGGPPAFVLSYPAQLVTSGIVLAFSVSLVLHVLFTAAYHLPLNRVNFVLQLVSSILMLVSASTKMGITISDMRDAGAQWPYMFRFMAPRLPNGTDWTTTQAVFYLLLQMLTLLTSHVRHIAHTGHTHPVSHFALSVRARDAHDLLDAQPSCPDHVGHVLWQPRIERRYQGTRPL